MAIDNRSPVNTDELWPSFDEAEPQVLRMLDAMKPDHPHPEADQRRYKTKPESVLCHRGLKPAGRLFAVMNLDDRRRNHARDRQHRDSGTVHR